MKNFLHTLMLAALIGCAVEAPSEKPPIMGNLETGDYDVGYRTLFLYDKTKVGIPYADWNDKLYRDHDPAAGRQSQINLWYPAKAGSGKPFKFEHYVHLMGRQTNFDDSEAQRKFGEMLFIESTNSLSGDTVFTATELRQLMDLDVYARLDADPVSGSYPTLVLPNGRNPGFQSIMGEYFASHGYVVVGCMPKGRYSAGLEISTLGLELGVDDLEFVLDRVGQLEMVDLDNVILGANAIYSSLCALAASRNQNVKGLISFEGGLPSNFEQTLLSRSPFYQPESITVPMLITYEPHPHIDPQYTEVLKYSKRHFARFPRMSEFAMLNYGIFDSFIPNIIGEHEGGTQDGYEAACKLILRYMNVVSGKVEGPVFNSETVSMLEGTTDTLFVWDALPSVPNIAITMDLFIEKGWPSVDSVYQQALDAGNSQPFSLNYINTYRQWLGWQKDDTYEYRYSLLKLAAASYPESAWANFYFGYYADKRGESAVARKHLRIALDLIPEDESPIMGVYERKVFKERGAEILASLAK